MSEQAKSGSLHRAIEQELAALEQHLHQDGYETFEAEAIVAGAREHAEQLLADEAGADVDAIRRLISEYRDTDVEPQRRVAEVTTSGGKMAITTALLAVVVMAAAFFADNEESGGALLLLSGAMGIPGFVAGWFARRQVAGIAAMMICAALLVFLILAIFV